MFHTLPQHHLVKNLPSAEPNEAVSSARVSQPGTALGASMDSVCAYDSSISGSLAFCNGCTSFRLESWLNAGLGNGLDCLSWQH